MEGAAIYYYKIRYTKDLRTNKTAGQLVGKDFQVLYGKLKGSDPDLLLVPIRAEGIENRNQEEDKSKEIPRKCNYIDAPVHISTTDPILLSKYFSFTIERESVQGTFMLRTTKQMWTIRENTAVRHYLTTNKIRLSSTSSTTEKRRECFFIYGAHDTLTKRDDFKKAIEKHQQDNEVKFGLYPGRRQVRDNVKHIIFRALLIYVTASYYEKDYKALMAAFNQAGEEDDIILGDLSLIPLRPTNEVTIKNIARLVRKQYIFSQNSKVAVLRGIKDLDISLTENTWWSDKNTSYFSERAVVAKSRRLKTMYI